MEYRDFTIFELLALLECGWDMVVLGLIAQTVAVNRKKIYHILLLVEICATYVYLKQFEHLNHVYMW